MISHNVSIELGGKEYKLETGKLAKFAGGSILVTCGETIVLVTVVASANAKNDIDFLPLSVEYREKVSAAGKIPGGFFKREGRPSEREILIARLIDRPIRPMLPKTWRYETQIVANVLSADPEVDPDTLSAVGASAALLISDVPFNGPISEVRVGKLDGEFIINPSYEQSEASTIDMTVAGTDTAITMVEGESSEISEEEFLLALDFAHDHIKKLNNLQKELLALSSKEKREFEVEEIPEDFSTAIKEAINDDLLEYVYSQSTKSERSEKRSTILEKALEMTTEKYGDDEELVEKIGKWTSKVVSELEKAEMRKMILEKGVRLDGRSTTDIRQITCEVGLLPRVHGSALFTRGETQALCSLTLGTSRDEQLIEGLQPVRNERFMLHYNFPPFCTGETGRMGVSRREVGHGHLAWRALKGQLPEQESFPYAIRLISDILESNGSSSMASVCGGSLALFDAGVPMHKPVAGIAMGLIKEDDSIAVLSDILGDEDFLGDMDFKVTGTAEGITAFQMDIKVEGLSMDIMKQALAQAKDARNHILGIMNETLSQPREDISKYAPKLQSFQVPQDMIGTIIGSGGETIRELTKLTNTEINIEDDGTVIVAAMNNEDYQKCYDMIQQLIKKPEEGEVYTGTVKEVREGLGAIIEFMPKQKGLLHISQISHERTENVGDEISVGDKIDVKLLEITRDGKFRLSRKALLERPEGMPPERDDRDRGRRDDRDRGRSSDRRDDRRGGDRRDSSRGSGGRR